MAELEALEALEPDGEDLMLVFQAVLNTANGDEPECVECKLFCRELLSSIEWPIEELEELYVGPYAADAWRAI